MEDLDFIFSHRYSDWTIIEDLKMPHEIDIKKLKEENIKKIKDQIDVEKLKKKKKKKGYEGITTDGFNILVK